MSGRFVLSLDFELIWGTLDIAGDGFRHAVEVERAVVIDRLLALLAEYEVPATWCVLGHLFLDHCSRKGGRVHPEIPRPTHSWAPGDWFARDPAASEETAPLFYGRSLVEKIRACPVRQEIGCHSFSHVIFGDPGCSMETADAELAASTAAAREMGLELRSFAFPRNSVGHLDVLHRHGITVFRGPGPRWYEREDARPHARAAHLLDVLTMAEPPTVTPQEVWPGLVNLPGSMIFFPRHGMRRLVPMAVRVGRACKGLEAAARLGRVFHLWFHPTNLADGIEAMFGGLRAVFAHARALRDRGRLDYAPMGAFASERGAAA